MNLAALMIADSRFPGGGHVHSGGVEEAVARRLVTDEVSLASFLLGRLRTAGALGAAFAAAATRPDPGSPDSGSPDPGSPDPGLLGAGGPGGLGGPGSPGPGDLAPDSPAPDSPAPGRLAELDAELDARTPSPAQRAASRAQGRGLARAARLAWPSPALTGLLRVTPRPHHPIIVGVLVGDPFEAAQTVAYHAVTGPATGAIRLLGLDPFGVNAVLARLAGEIDAVAEAAARHADTDPVDLPAPGSPGLDLLAEAHDRHHREEVRLFVS
ncbi:urease accessory protein UreF [Actinosynnema sp. NPDC059797]